jgi:hypothetical protein
MKFPKSTKILTTCGVLLLLTCVIFQVVMYVQQFENINNNEGVSLDYNVGFAPFVRWSIVIGLVGTALILGSTNINLDFTKARLGTSIIGTLLLLGCIVMQVISYTESGKIKCSGDKNKPITTCDVTDPQNNKSELYYYISVTCGILSISILSGGLQL